MIPFGRKKAIVGIKAATGLGDQEKPPQTSPSETLQTRQALITCMGIVRSWLFGGYKRQTWDMWRTGSPPVKVTLVGAVLTHPHLVA